MAEPHGRCLWPQEQPNQPAKAARTGPALVVAAGEPISLGRLVALSGVPPSTVHHYRRLGLLPEPELTRPGRYVYSEVHLHALQLIRELREERAMGLGQIKAVLPDLMDGRHPLPPATADCSEEPQKRLVDAAFKLFSEPKGYAAVTVSEIAATAGVAKGTVYRHFPSKEALFTAVVESLCQDTAERFAQAVAELGGPRAWLTTRARPQSSSVGSSPGPCPSSWNWARGRPEVTSPARSSLLGSCVPWRRQPGDRCPTTRSRPGSRSSRRRSPPCSSGPSGPIGHYGRHRPEPEAAAGDGTDAVRIPPPAGDLPDGQRQASATPFVTVSKMTDGSVSLHHNSRRAVPAPGTEGT